MSAASTADKPPKLTQSTPEFTEESVQRLRQLRTHLQALVHHPGWLYLRQVLESQSDKRLQHLCYQQPFSTRDMIEQAMARGEASALVELTQYPEFLEAAMAQQIANLGFDPDEDDENLKEPELNG